jgi:2-keto-4-pentenoate hydratase/2-oxohepta-3-ene-1,7-dioic acid hydratase in catechol pathway
MRLGPVGEEIPVVHHQGSFLDLRALTRDITPDFLGDQGVDRVALAVRDADRLTRIENTTAMRVGAPLRDPGAILCVGQNYAAHARESGAPPPDQPIVFLKHPGSLIGPNDDIHLPPGSTHLDWEVELAVVIGTACHALGSPHEALDHVAGYTIANDVSERAWQLDHSGGQWTKGKSAPTFCPLGPFLRTADGVDPQALELSSQVNGEKRQHSTTADMLFSVQELIFHLSQYLRLNPGDVLLTGTPEGVAFGGRHPYLRPGDEVVLRVEGLGEQHQVIVERPSSTGSSSPTESVGGPRSGTNPGGATSDSFGGRTPLGGGSLADA